MTKLFFAFVFFSVAFAGPSYFREDGIIHNFAVNFAQKIPLPRIPEIQIEVSSLPISFPSLRQKFVNLPLPSLIYERNYVTAPQY